MQNTLPIGPMPQIVNNSEVIQLAFKWGFQPANSDYNKLDCLEYLNELTPPGYWIGWNNEDDFGVWPDGDLTD